MVNFSDKSHFWSWHWVIFRQKEFQFEYSALKWRSFRTYKSKQSIHDRKNFKKSWNYLQLRHENTGHFVHLEQPKFLERVLALTSGSPKNIWNKLNINFHYATQQFFITFTILLGKPAILVSISGLLDEFEFLVVFSAYSRVTLCHWNNG